MTCAGRWMFENCETARILFADGAAKGAPEGGWLKSPKTQGADANYYNRAWWNVKHIRNEIYFIESLATKRLLFATGGKIAGERGKEGGWKAASGFESPKIVGSDANYYNRAYWKFHKSGKTADGKDFYLIENVETGRYLFQDGTKLTKKRGSEGGWKSSSGFESPSVVGADANYYNRARWFMCRNGSELTQPHSEGPGVSKDVEEPPKEEPKPKPTPEETAEETACAGKIVVCEDEWTTSDRGFTDSGGNCTKYVQNIGDWFMSGKKGRFLVFSNNFGLCQKKIKEAMEAKGHTWRADLDAPFTSAANLKRDFDAIFVGGIAANNKVLIDYVERGGCVYLCGGTGVGGPAGEARNWKTFLMHFGLKFGTVYNGSGGSKPTCLPIKGNHPILNGVSKLLFWNGNSIFDIDADSEANQVVHSNGKDGSIAVYDGSKETLSVIISAIGYDGIVPRSEADEFVEVSNIGGITADISGWKVNAGDKNQDFIFPDGTFLKPAESCRVYTNEIHPETGGFSFEYGKAIWNNTEGDVGTLYDKGGKEISSLGYATMADGSGTDDGVMVVRK